MNKENEFRIVGTAGTQQEAVDIQQIAKTAKIGIQIRTLNKEGE